jgi:signal transduction histidine kinase
MKNLWIFNPHTIRHRLLSLSAIAIVMIIVLVSVYSYQLVSLENKLVTMEQVDDLFNGILELRRYEKNIMLELKGDNLASARNSLAEIRDSLTTLIPSIEDSRELAMAQTLQKSLDTYSDLFRRWSSLRTGKPMDSIETGLDHTIRVAGQKMLDTAAKMVRLKRKNISKGFKSILFWLTFMPVTLFIIGAVIFFVQTRSILHRLDILKQGTKNLAAGEFQIIESVNGSPDEVSGLINNFNLMVEALEQKQEQLIQSKKMASIGTFSSGIAHEINNPLNNISLSTDVLLEEFTSMDKEETEEILGDIMEQTERASTIVRNLLDFSRDRASNKEPLYIDFILHKTTELIANELRIHKIALHKEIEDYLPRVNGDLRKLQQVFLNLIINAEQAIGEYGRIVVRASKAENDFIRIDIQDTGPGIAPENLDQIFDPFFTTKEAGKGTGLGLAIVYGIVKKHGGYIEVASKLGEGTTFSVYLPVIYSAADPGEETKQ